MRRFAPYAAIWLATCVTFAALFWLLTMKLRHLGQELRDHGAIALATVTSSSPTNHNQICVRFEVAGKTYAGCDSADFDKSASQLAPGDTTHVTYDVRDPSVFRCRRASTILFSSSALMTLFGALWMGTPMSIALIFLLRKRTAQLVGRSPEN